MVDHHTISFEIKKAGQQDRSIIHGSNRSSGVNAKVKALMLALRDAVENALRADRRPMWRRPPERRNCRRHSRSGVTLVKIAPL